MKGIKTEGINQHKDMTIQDKWVDLHIHTCYSDGMLTPKEAVTYAKEVGLSGLGIVDHDCMDGIPEGESVGREIGIDVVRGLELSSEYQNKDIHIIGYYFDMNNPRLNKYLLLFQNERFKRAVKMVKNLQRTGIQITMDEVEEKAKGKSIGRPHLAEILMEKGYVETFQEAFHKYIGYGSKAYVKKYTIDPVEAVHLIHDAKGLAVLAHPGSAVNNELIMKLIKAGLDGIEVVHPNLNDRRTTELQSIANEYHLLISGGSDCHGGRNGSTTIGNYRVPYTIVEDMKQVLVERYGNLSHLN